MIYFTDPMPISSIGGILVALLTCGILSMSKHASHVYKVFVAVDISFFFPFSLSVCFFSCCLYLHDCVTSLTNDYVPLNIAT